MKTRDLAIKIHEFMRDPPRMSLPLPGDRDHGDENPPVHKPVLFLNPSLGEEYQSGQFVVVPGSELRLDSVPPNPNLIDAWLGSTWLQHAGVSGGGFRDHDTGGGYSLNVAAHACIEVRRIGTYWFLSASTYARDRLHAEEYAKERDVSGYYDRDAWRYVRANEYGDYRQFGEVTRADRLTDLMGRATH